MSSGSFQKTSPAWELQKLSGQVNEAVERLLANLFGNSPIPDNWTLPEWWLQGIFWLVLLSLLGWGGWQVYRLLRPYLMRVNPMLGRRVAQETAAEPELTAAEWLGRSRLAQRQGNYREACRALYMAALHHLHANDLIRHQPSRTDGEYLQLLQTLPNPLPYQVLIHTHERLFFGPTNVSASEFEQCRQAYQEIAPL